MSAASAMMAGPFKRMNRALDRWWMGHKDKHYQIVSTTAILSTAATLWGILFLFILDGTTDPTKAAYVPWSWAGLIFGGLIAFWVLPEFFVYLGHKASLDEILLLDSRPEVLRRRKEAEEAADMLGPRYQAHLVRLYNEMGIKVSSRFRHIAPAGSEASAAVDASAGDADSQDAEDDFAEPWDEIEVKAHGEGMSGFFSDWWNTGNSRLSRELPRATLLREINANRALALASASSAGLLLWNMVFGLAVSEGGGPREYTVDLSMMLAGESSIHATAPHFDGVGLLLAATSLFVLNLTRPVGKARPARATRASKSSKRSQSTEEE